MADSKMYTKPPMLLLALTQQRSDGQWTATVLPCWRYVSPPHPTERGALCDALTNIRDLYPVAMVDMLNNAPECVRDMYTRPSSWVNALDSVSVSLGHERGDCCAVVFKSSLAMPEVVHG